MGAESKLNRQQRRRDKKRRAKERWRKEHMANTTPGERAAKRQERKS